MGLCFIDTETTGLDPDRHSIWEVALITPNNREYVWQFPIEEVTADPFALDIGRYWDRRWPTDERSRLTDESGSGLARAPTKEWAQDFRNLTAGHHLAGAVVSFDEERLRRLLRRLGVLHRWHYHLICCETLAVGWLAHQGVHLELPWNSNELSEHLGIDPTAFDRHTALGDCKWAKAIWERVSDADGSGRSS